MSSRRMLLISKSTQIEISHFYYLVSAYVGSEGMHQELRDAVTDALKKAKETSETQIVDLDRIDFCFHVYPSGAISLMGALAQFESVWIPDNWSDERPCTLQKAPIEISLSYEALDKLNRLAYLSDESVSSVIQRIITEWNPKINH